MDEELMTLLDPDAGEILDRLSILARKRLEKPERKHFEEEESSLLKHFWASTKSIGVESFIQHLLRLSAVNMALWQAEDELRELRRYAVENQYDFSIWTPCSMKLAKSSMRLQSLNEERSRLIQFFNAELGRGAVEEKDFSL